jgi:hypothetical protein
MPNYRGGAGHFDHRFAFDEREVIDDGYGNLVAGDFKERFQMRADMIVMKGGEDVMAARLEGIQPIILRVRVCGESKQITTDWRARDARTGELYNIMTITKDAYSGSVFEMFCRSGVAIG